MYVESLLTFRNIDVTAPTIGATVGYSKIYVGDDTLYHAYYDEITGSTIDRVSSVRLSELVDNGLVFFNEVTGGRDKFTCLSPNLTTTQLVLASSGDGASNPSFEWVDINDWIPAIPDVYWSRNTYGLYPTTLTDNVCIGIEPTTVTNSQRLYVNGDTYVKDGNITASDGNIVAVAQYNYVGNYDGYLITHIDNAKNYLLTKNADGVTLDHLMTYLIPNDIIAGETSYIGARSIEDSFNDTGYGFKRDTSQTVSTGTYSIDHSLYEFHIIDYTNAGTLTVTLTNPIRNKIVTLTFDSNSANDTIVWPSSVSIVSGEFVPNSTNYIQIMCIDSTSPYYLVTYSQDLDNISKANWYITDLADVQSDYSTLKDRILRVDPTGSGIVYTSLLGGTTNSTDGYIPSWNGTTGCLLSDGYAVATDLATHYTSAYLATADVIKEAIDTQKIQSVSASADVDADTKLVLVDKSAGDVTLTFPDLSSSRARVWKVKDITASDNNNKVIIATAGSQTIEGGTTLEIEGNNFARDVIFATNYYIA